MDGVRNEFPQQGVTTVVRQFAPSRIERQLLAQIIELVCALKTELGQPSVGDHNTESGEREVHSVATSRSPQSERIAA